MPVPDDPPEPSAGAAAPDLPRGEGPREGPPVHRFDVDLVAIDTLMGGMTSVTAGYLIEAPRPALIECGPARTIDHTIAGLRAAGLDPDDLAYLVLTHVHLDHAGGAGDVARAFPNATIVVSEVGARHLHQPDRLNTSARRVYGELFDRVYGACTPIEEQRIHGAADRDRLDLGGGHVLELLYTPGHAKHHIGVLDHATGAIFSGDSVGVKLPGMHHLRPATPPPDFHLDAALASLDAYRDREPTRLYLAHYGPVDPPADALDEAADRLRLWVETAEEAYRTAGGPTGTELDHVTETLAARFSDDVDPLVLGADPDGRRRLDLLSGAASNAAGIVRFLRRRDDGTLTPVG